MKDIIKKRLDIINIQKLHLNLSLSCNQKCPYCWHQVKKPPVLVYKVLKKFINDISKYNMNQIILSGGEPTVWPEIIKFLKYLKKRIKNITICTNGFLLKEKKFIKKLFDIGLYELIISVDTLDPKKFQYLRNYSFEIFKEIISNCINFKTKYPKTKIVLSSVLSKLVTPDDILKVYNFSKNCRFNFYVKYFDKTGYKNVDKKFYLSKKEKLKYNKKLSWIDGSIAKTLKRTDNPLLNKKSYIECLKGYTSVKVAYNGDVKFCWNSDVIGNISQQSFKDIWESKKANKLREHIYNKKCKCDLDCDIIESLILYNKYKHLL